MKVKTILQSIFMLMMFVSMQNAFANKEVSSEIQTYEKNFTFDWNNYASIAPNKLKINKIENFLKTIKDQSNLTAADRHALGKLFYKLGTYYTHIAREPDLAIVKLKAADALLTNKQDLAWNYNHLAYAYELKYADTKEKAAKIRAINCTNKVIFDLYADTKNKEVAFAYCVKGLVQNDAKDFVQAEDSFKTALNIYEQTPNGKDDQYARAKNRLASIILDQNGRDKEAIVMLQQLKQYWLSKHNISQDPYAARNFITLGQAYLKVGNMPAAHNELTRAITIYKKLYGVKSPLLTVPNQLLSESTKTLNKKKNHIAVKKTKAVKSNIRG